MKSIVLAENACAARELCAGARAVAGEVGLVSFGGNLELGCSDVVYSVAVPGESVIDDAYETLVALVDEKKPDFVFVEPTRRMKLLAGRLAARNETCVITDVIEFSDEVATSLYFGGVAHKKQKHVAGLRIFTVGSGVFADLPVSGSDAVELVEWVQPRNALVRRSSKQLPKAETDLTKSEIVVAAGRGFAAEEDLQLARDLAAKVGGDLGCTRPLTEGVDWLPRELYIGVSGLMLSPKIYIGVGLSGQMQHMVGINRAKIIVAINKDKNAPIFKQCDYGLVGDLKTVLPLLTAAL